MLLRPPGVGRSRRSAGLRVERVTGAGALRDWERVAVDGFPYRELQPYRPGRCWTSGSWTTGGCGCGSATSRTGPSASARCSWTPGWRTSRSG